MPWPYKKTIIISRCFWDYYLHVFQKDYAYELKNEYGVEVTWVDRPTRNPMLWFKERRRIVDGITVLRPWSLSNEYEKFNLYDRKIFTLQISKDLQSKHNTALWSICCMHPWLSKNKAFNFKIYWPGDHFDPKEEYLDYKDYDLVMPWVGLNDIPSEFSGKRFLSSTCAGLEFMNFQTLNTFPQAFREANQFSKRISYIGGLSYERFDFELMEKLASSMSNCVFLLGVKSDGLESTEKAKAKLLKNNKNIRIFEDLNYQELAELVSISDLGIIPYRIHGQNLRICPNKFFEYSALCKMTVTTAIPSMKRYSPPAKIAHTHEEFIKLTNNTLDCPLVKDQLVGLRKIAEEASAKKTIPKLVNVLNNN